MHQLQRTLRAIFTSASPKARLIYHKHAIAANVKIRHKNHMIQLISTDVSQRIVPVVASIRFDTRRHGRLVCGAFLICGIVLSFGAWGLSHTLHSISDQQSFAAILLITLANFWTAFWCFRHYAGAHGIIDCKTITIDPDRLLGLSTLAPRGSFTVARFRVLRLQGGLREGNPTRLMLIGLPHTADIMLFYGDRRKASTLANEIGLLLRLPIETLTPTA